MAILSNINGKFAVDSSGGIQFSGQTGTSGYVLKSNGNAAPTWVDGSTVIGGPYLPLSGGTLTGATATASGISFTVGGALTGITGSFNTTAVAPALTATSGWSGTVSNPIITFGRQASAVAGSIGYDDPSTCLYIGSTTNHKFKIRVNNNDIITCDTTSNTTFSGDVNIGQNESTATRQLTIGQGRTGNGFSFIDLVGDATYTDYGFRMLRGNGGANSLSLLDHRGTGEFQIKTEEAAPIVFKTTATERMRISANGNVTFSGTAIFDGDMTLPAAADNFLIGASGLATTGKIKFGDVSWNNSIGLESYWMVMRSNQNEGYKFIDSAGSIYVQLNAGNNSAGANYSYFKGRIGIGTTAPNDLLDIHSASASGNIGMKITRGTQTHGFRIGVNDSHVFLWTTEAQDMAFATSGVQRMNITSGGQIEIRNGATVAGQIKASGADNDLAINGKRGQIIFEIADVQKAVLDALQFYPATDNGLNLGTSFLRFSTVYATNGVNTSDETLKENIKECDLGIDFINSLKPKSYNLKDLKEDDDAYGKKRYGLIAQDLLQTELKDSVFGKKDGEYGLSYNDLIAPMIKAIQELKAEIEILKKK